MPSIQQKLLRKYSVSILTLFEPNLAVRSDFAIIYHLNNKFWNICDDSITTEADDPGVFCAAARQTENHRSDLNLKIPELEQSVSLFELAASLNLCKPGLNFVYQGNRDV